jgi:hypothetical protein
MEVLKKVDANMSISERIKEVRTTFCNGSNVEFAKILGERNTATSNWVSGSREVSLGVIKKIIEKFPQVSTHWLLTGEGEMLRPSVNQNNIEGDNIQGHTVTVNKSHADKLLDLLKTKDEQLIKSQEQIDRLIGLLEKNK